MASTLDGSAGAPAGVSQFSNILNGYAVRPDWQVAGVDYYVGTPTGTALKNPATISMAGVSVDKSTHIITVTSSNVTLSGYDFGLDGGWQVNVTNNANNVTIQNSSFKVGANNLMPIQAYYGGTINVLNNTFDGGASNGSSVNAMVFTGSGGANIEYNRFTNFPNDGIDITRDGDFVVQYNLFDTMGSGQYHTDAIQTYFSSISSLSIQYNTVYQPPSVSSGTMNAFVRIGDQQDNVVHNPVAAYNTIIMASTASQTANVFQWDSQGSGTLLNPQIHDNFIDPKGVMYGIVSPTLQNTSGVTNPVTYNNVDLSTGKQILNSQYNSHTSGIPAKGPATPVIIDESVVGTAQVKLTGTAGAGVTVDIFDQGHLIGAVKAGSNGSWSYTTPQLSSGDHSFSARATDTLANSSASSNVWSVTVTSSGIVDGGSGTAPGNGTAPGVPVITAFSDDSGVQGDGITNDKSITLQGTAAAGSTIKVLDGTNVLGTVVADGSGNWSFTSSSLADGSHKFTATASNASGTSPASAARAVVIDTAAPNAPTLSVSTSAAALAASKVAVLTGTAEANSTVKVYDGTTQIGTATTGSNGAWTFTTAALASGSHSFTAKAMDAAGNTSNTSSAVPVTVSNPSTPPVTTKPDAPVITSFSEDSGVKGDGITNDNTIALTGTAAANSTIKIYDGSTQIGTATAAANGSWNYITSVLTDAKHMLTATATNGAGQTSAASSALAITVDTKAPDAPSIGTGAAAGARAVSQSNASPSGTPVNLTGVAEAKSSVAIYDGNTKIGTVTAGTDGSWSFSTSSLSIGQHKLTAKATDAAGNVGAASAALTVNVTSTTPVPPTAPKIVSFSNDTGKVGDGITSDNTLKLVGTAATNSTVTVYDGTQKLGTVQSDSNGGWSFDTAVLRDGSHNFTAKVTDSNGQTGAVSDVTKVVIDTKAPGTPSLGVFTDDGKALNGQTKIADVMLKGTAEANSQIKLYDAGKLIGETTTKGDGTWSFDPGHLSNGSHQFSAIASDVAGNASAASAAKAISVIDAPSHGTGMDLTQLYQIGSSIAVIKGTADAYSQVKIFDGAKEVGTVKANGDGDWWYGTGAVSSNSVHTFSAKQFDQSGHVVSSSGNAILGTAGADTLKGTSGNDIFVGNGHADTFVFAPNFGNDTIKDFGAKGSLHDVVQFSKSMFDNFADVLAHATQSGQDVVISSGNDSLTLKNTKLAALDKSDFHFT